MMNSPSQRVPSLSRLKFSKCPYINLHNCLDEFIALVVMLDELLRFNLGCSFAITVCFVQPVRSKFIAYV